MKKITFIAILVLTFSFGCKDEKEDMPQGTQVQMNSNSFLPSIQTVTVGTTVKWTNSSQVTHTVTSSSDLFDETLSPGSEFSFTFSNAGTNNYVCTIHSGMSGTIVVE